MVALQARIAACPELGACVAAKSYAYRSDHDPAVDGFER